MPTTLCPHCAGDIQFPDFMATTVVSCPRPGCGRPVQLPNADGTPYVPPPVPVPPPLPAMPEAAEEYFLRKPTDPDLVVGPLGRDRLRKLARHGSLRLDDELSVDRRHWWRADRIDPELFGLTRAIEKVCPECGAKFTGDAELCPGCAGEPEGEAEPAAGSAPAPAGPARSALGTDRVLSAPEALTELASARAFDTVLGASPAGWLGLWSVADGKRRRTWEFDGGQAVRLAIADRGGSAVLAVSDGKVTRLYLADFDSRRLTDLVEFDGGVHALAMSPDGRDVALVDDGPDVRLYRVDPWKRLDKLPVCGTRFALDLGAERLAAADDDGRVQVWDLAEGEVERELAYRGGPACPRRPLRMAFSRNGGRLYVATGELVAAPSSDPDAGACQLRARLERVTTLRSWDLEKGKLTAEFGGVLAAHPTGIADAYFGPRGLVAATVGETTARAWDLAAGKDLGPIYEVTDPAEMRQAQAARRTKTAPLIRRVDFTEDGEHALVLVGGSRDVRVVRWPSPPRG